MPVSFLSKADRERLRSFPANISSEDLQNFFTLSNSDLEQIKEQRSDHNKLGFALQLCALRYLGFVPNALNTVSDNIIAYIAQQLDIDKGTIEYYGKRDQTRTQHLLAIQTYLGFQKASKQDFALLAQWLLERAPEHDKPNLLLQFACEKLHRDKIVRPGLISLEKMVAKTRQKAQEKVYLLLMPLLTPVLCEMLDSLLVVDPKINRTPLSWLRERATSNSAQQILIGIDKLRFLKQLQVDKWDVSNVNPNRLRFLAKIGRKVNNQYLQRLNQQRRYPILVATLHQSLIDLTDEIIDIWVSPNKGTKTLIGF